MKSEVKGTATSKRLGNTAVEFYSKNKFEKLVHLVGFIVHRKYIEQNIINLRA